MSLFSLLYKKRLQNLEGKSLHLLEKETLVRQIMKTVSACNIQRIIYSFKR